MNIQTADLCDQHEALVQVVAPMFHSYGGRRSFGGPIATLKVFEDNSLVRKALETPWQWARPGDRRWRQPALRPGG